MHESRLHCLLSSEISITEKPESRSMDRLHGLQKSKRAQSHVELDIPDGASYILLNARLTALTGCPICEPANYRESENSRAHLGTGLHPILC
jgi:hypothetical protein